LNSSPHPDEEIGPGSSNPVSEESKPASCGAYRYWKESCTVDNVRGLGRAIFAAVLLMIGGVLNIIYGIAAISNSHFFDDHTSYVFGSLKTWGWITLILGVIELLASASLFGGGTFGRWFGIFAGSLVAIEALLQIPSYPILSLAIFGLSLWIIYGLVIYGEPQGPVDMPASAGVGSRSSVGTGPQPPS
jgi:hypothetical protein